MDAFFVKFLDALGQEAVSNILGVVLIWSWIQKFVFTFFTVCSGINIYERLHYYGARIAVGKPLLEIQT